MPLLPCSPSGVDDMGLNPWQSSTNSAVLPAGTRSITVRLIFRAADRTLTDSEVEQAVSRLLTSLERELDVTLRSS